MLENVQVDNKFTKRSNFKKDHLYREKSAMDTIKFFCTAQFRICIKSRFKFAVVISSLSSEIDQIKKNGKTKT